MRARAGEQKREASQTSVRSKRRGSKQLHRQRHRLQRDQVERQALLGRFRASSTPESVKAVSTKTPIIRRSCDEAGANPPRNRNGFCARYANQFPPSRSAKQACNRDHNSSDTWGQARKQHKVGQEHKHCDASPFDSPVAGRGALRDLRLAWGKAPAS